ncbi:conserved hypothetical protein [Ricinus communis]|uniref:RNase H type-1 domain-containing protein n=1 Tax=Ricinus communis TaxID=3988 RepID=B9RUT0_RICCO|nr:conserved hypothetical protein [Ricinus communis]
MINRTMWNSGSPQSGQSCVDSTGLFIPRRKLIRELSKNMRARLVDNLSNRFQESYDGVRCTLFGAVLRWLWRWRNGRVLDNTDLELAGLYLLTPGFKFNIDDCAKGIPGRAGAGGLICDRYVGTCTTIEAELGAVIKGVIVAHNKGVQSSMVEVDCQVVVSW